MSHFLLFDLPNNPKNHNFEKLKKSTEDIIILHLRTTNDDHVMYGSWETECNKQNFLSFWAIFCPFTPPKNPENQNFEKNEKNSWKYYHFTHEYHKRKSFDLWFLRYRAQQTQFFLIFGPFFALSPPPFLLPLTTQRIKTLTKWKKHWRYHHFTQVYNKWQPYDIWFLRYEVQQTEFFVILGHFLLF